MVDDASGGNIHHFQTGLEIELANDFDLDLTLYADKKLVQRKKRKENEILCYSSCIGCCYGIRHQPP
jgi:hypothetical protein